MERTLSIIKPDGMKRKLVGDIIKRLEKQDLKIIAMKVVHLTKEQAEKFYEVHAEKPFYNSLVQYMTSGPVIPLVLEGDDVINRLRKVMGATDPAKADYNTIRRDFGISIERNIIHGSDAPETARTEVAFFFDDKDFVQY
jgi:nucleoside-diphosphate kinase